MEHPHDANHHKSGTSARATYFWSIVVYGAHRYLFSPANKVARLLPSSCSVEWAEDAHDYYACLPTGAIYLYASSSVHTMGSTSFLNNIAGDDGGKQRLPPLGKWRRDHSAC